MRPCSRLLPLLLLALLGAGCPSIPNPFAGGDEEGGIRTRQGIDSPGGINFGDRSSPERAVEDSPERQAAMREARDRQLAARMNQRGQVALVRTEYEKAAEEFHGAVRLAPDVAAYHNNLGTALYRNGQIRESLAVYARAMEIDPENVVIRVNVANALRQLEQYQDATVQYHAALEFDPTHAPAHLELGKLYLRTGDYENAAYRIDRALELDPGYNEAIVARVILRHQRNEFREAWEDIQTLDRRGILIDEELRRAVMEGVRRERARERYQPVH
jgi:tetratricopeptide (TPR) repeat protein